MHPALVHWGLAGRRAGAVLQHAGGLALPRRLRGLPADLVRHRARGRAGQRLLFGVLGLRALGSLVAVSGIMLFVSTLFYASLIFTFNDSFGQQA
jgi:hypothetical protein